MSFADLQNSVELSEGEFRMQILIFFVPFLALISLPIVTIGWNTFGWGEEFADLKFSGPFNNRLIAVDYFLRKDWNARLIIAYLIKLKLLRLLQIIMILLIVVYVWQGLLVANIAMTLKINPWDLAFTHENSVPAPMLALVMAAAVAWALGIFVKALTSTLNSDKELIERRIRQK